MIGDQALAMTANIRRTFNALLVVAIAILGGGALAYWLGNQFALASGRHETQAYALNLLQRAEILAHETDQSLEEANASPGQPCSSNDLEYIRQITFKYWFIKDIGRIIDGRLTCTSFRGVLASPSIASSPDLIIANGLKIWANIRLPLAPSVNSVLVETGKTNIVIDPGAFQDLEQPPFRYSIAIVNVAKGKVLRSWGQSLVSDAVLISGDRAFTAGAQLYDVECSQPYAICSVAALSVHDALEKQRSFVAGFTLFGAAGAGLAALVVLLLRGRDRTLLERLREAIKSEELKIVYQPIHHLGSGSVVAAEALIRWTDHNGTAIPPNVFIPVAEEAGIASDIPSMFSKRWLQKLVLFFVNIPSSG
jgi:sensor c-di-GMP phosphodiesterase-like protein